MKKVFPLRIERKCFRKELRFLCCIAEMSKNSFTVSALRVSEKSADVDGTSLREDVSIRRGLVVRLAAERPNRSCDAPHHRRARLKETEGNAKADGVGKKKMVIRDDKPGILGESERRRTKQRSLSGQRAPDTPLLCAAAANRGCPPGNPVRQFPRLRPRKPVQECLHSTPASH